MVLACLVVTCITDFRVEVFHDIEKIAEQNLSFERSEESDEDVYAQPPNNEAGILGRAVLLVALYNVGSLAQGWFLHNW